MRRPELPPLTPFGQRLAWVLGGLGLAVLPHIGHLPVWITLLAAASATLRFVIEVKHWSLPPKWLRIAVAFAALIGVVLTYRTLNGVEAGSALLIVMAGMKLLETRTVRDLTVILFLCYFSLYSAFLYNQEFLYLPYLLVTTWWLTATLMRIHQTALAMRAGEAARITAKMLLQALPLAALLFLFFPRLPGQFWALPARSESRSGLDEEMSPGDVSDLSLSGAVAFRVRFDGPIPPPRQRYWRGPVLHDFDGRTWRRSRNFFLPQEVQTSGTAYRYRITLEPHQRNWVFALDMPIAWPDRRMLRTPDFQLMTGRRQISVLTSFDLVSRPNYRVTGELPTVMQRQDLRLPQDRNPRTRALAQEMRASAGSDAAYVQAVLDKFRNEEFFYTLEPPRLATDSVDDFLFNTRRGFCEHFASAFTAMMRAAGIPSRIVTGYQGGDYNPIGGHLVVRQSNAHAWSEVWIEGQGWLRMDPTAAVAPERIEGGGLDAALTEDEPVPGRLLRESALLSQFVYAWDAMNQFWNDQVIAFGDLQQRWLLRKLSFEDADWRTLGLILAASLAGFFVVLSVYLGWTFRPRRRDPVAQVYHQLCRKLAQRNLPRLSHEGPNDYTDRICAARPDLARQMAEIRKLYIGLRYGPSPLSSQLSRLKFLVNQL